MVVQRTEGCADRNGGRDRIRRGGDAAVELADAGLVRVAHNRLLAGAGTGGAEPAPIPRIPWTARLRLAAAAGGPPGGEESPGTPGIPPKHSWPVRAPFT